MKNHVELDHLTKFDAFMLHRGQAMDLWAQLKMRTNISLQRPPKSHKLQFRFTFFAMFIKWTY